MSTTTFVPAVLDATDLEVVLPLYRSLIDREVMSESDLESWLLDRSELEAACSEAQANLYIATTCNTEDEEAQSAFTSYIENVQPKLKPLAFELDKKQAELSKQLGFDAKGSRYEVITRDTVADVELFREKNIPLETELAKLDQKYDQVCGKMTVEFDGEEKTLPQMGRELESTDRGRREQAWRAITARRLQDRDTIDDIYNHMIKLRHDAAQNAGYDNYVGYAFASKHRFDYSPADCFAFHEAIEKTVVPFVRKLDAQRAEALGVDKLRPWDLAVDVKGREPLRPFSGGVDLVSKTHAALHALDPRLASMFAELGDGSGRAGSKIDENTPPLDLDSRKGKAPGGYQYMRDRSRVPFIFMNAAGLHRDVETMVHEAGHAFHSMLCIDEPLLHYRHSPIEFAEVASMSMELLTMPHWGVAGSYYDNPEELARAQRAQLEGSMKVLPWIATIDAFQHWIYENPGHTPDERRAYWLELDERFGHAVSWEGIEDSRPFTWQRQGHLFGVPFYYIEYGIAQLGSFQLWLRSIEEGPEAAITSYIDALSLGGSRPLPELFDAAGIAFDFSPAIVGKLVDRVEKEVAKLPE